jgi:hypothetical protein
MTEEQIRKHIYTVVMNKVQEQDESRRKEALQEFMTVTATATGDVTAEKVAEMVPPLMENLYDKWIGMFIDRLLETAPRDALQLLCDGTQDNDAALLLAYIMFLESERMEEQTDKDLREYGREMSGTDEMGDIAADYIRSRMAAMADKAQNKQ